VFRWCCIRTPKQLARRRGERGEVMGIGMGKI
jgi:hypothetical protein